MQLHVLDANRIGQMHVHDVGQGDGDDGNGDDDDGGGDGEVAKG